MNNLIFKYGKYSIALDNSRATTIQYNGKDKIFSIHLKVNESGKRVYDVYKLDGKTNKLCVTWNACDLSVDNLNLPNYIKRFLEKLSCYELVNTHEVLCKTDSFLKHANSHCNNTSEVLYLLKTKLQSYVKHELRTFGPSGIYLNSSIETLDDESVNGFKSNTIRIEWNEDDGYSIYKYAKKSNNNHQEGTIGYINGGNLVFEKVDGDIDLMEAVS